MISIHFHMPKSWYASNFLLWNQASSAASGMSHVGLKAFARWLGDRRLKACALGCCVRLRVWFRLPRGFHCGPSGCRPYRTPFPCLVCVHAPAHPPLSLLSFSSRPITIQSPPPCGALRRHLSPSTSSRGRGCQSSLDLALASSPRGSIFLQHRKYGVQRGWDGPCGCVLTLPPLRTLRPWHPFDVAEMEQGVDRSRTEWQLQAAAGLGTTGDLSGVHLLPVFLCCNSVGCSSRHSFCLWGH
jgi:hypothetical protein